MTIRKLSLLILLISCNVANSQELTKAQIEQRIKQVEQERDANDIKQQQLINTQGVELKAAKAQLDTVDSITIPTLQNAVNSLQDKYNAVVKRYHALKYWFISVASLLLGAFILFLLLKFNILLPYGWITIPAAMAIISTWLTLKI